MHAASANENTVGRSFAPLPSPLWEQPCQKGKQGKLSQKAKDWQNCFRKSKMVKSSQKRKDVKIILKSKGLAKLSQKGKGVPHLRISKTKEMPMVCAI
jgi:hypothetical protein